MRANRRGITLLELILALALAVLVLGAIGWAIRLHLRALDIRRTDVEEAQLARAVLKIIADDLRSVVAHNGVDLEEAARLSAESGVPGLEGEESGEGGNGGEGGESPPPDEEEGEEGAEGEEDISSDLTPGAIPGIYGNQYQLEIDVSRLPRIEDFDPALRDAAGRLPDLPSEVKTVAYYLLPDLGPAAEENTLGQGGLGLATAASATSAPGRGRGLVRRALDRAATEWALENGDQARLDRNGDLLAMEIIAVEFRYFDGQMWQLSWDTQENGGLPVAVEVAIAIAPSEDSPRASTSSTMADAAHPTTASLLAGPLADQNVKIFHQVIRIPAAEPSADAEAIEIEAE